MAKKQATIEEIRHSLAHLLAAAVLKKYPKTKLGIGPVIENGFYYDFLFTNPISEADLGPLEKEMRDLIAQKLDFKAEKITALKAKKLFAGQKFKLELIKELQKEKSPVSVYHTGNIFTDLCKGPHVRNAGEINPDAFKLTHLAGAYWRGDEKNPMLTRIYGLAFGSKKELDDYSRLMEEAKKRDHRILGQQLELFMFDDEVGQGLPLWLPKGALLKHIIQTFAFETYLKNGYEPVSTPHIASKKLWSHSGHLDFYKESMYESFGIEGEEYLIKPMNCPFHVRMYLSKKRSYRELPFRWTEMGTVYRYERSGTLHGLTRVRGFTQDDAHIICSPEQLSEEVSSVLELTLYMLKIFGFKDFEINLSTRNPKDKKKFIGSDKNWEMAENTLKSVLKRAGFKNIFYDVGGAVFYGPKIDVKVADALGRKIQLSTIQFDFNLPGRFKMAYTGPDGKEHTPYMVHRALLGSLERFIGILIEHYAGAFPIWLSPVQARVLTISDKQKNYAEKILADLKKSGIRAELSDENETVGKKIRNAELQKIPYILVAGDKEIRGNSVNIRHHEKGMIGEMKLEKFIEQIKREIAEKK